MSAKAVQLEPDERLDYDLVPSPLGDLGVVVDSEGRLLELRFNGLPREVAPTMHCAEIRTQLHEYFSGHRREFTLPMAPRGTAFQQRVWRALCDIGFGSVRNYGDVARAIGQPGAARAVGQANGANPLPIVIPCHRVIASDGSIGGYSSGLAVKHRLLAHEGVIIDL